MLFQSGVPRLRWLDLPIVFGISAGRGGGGGTVKWKSNRNRDPLDDPGQSTMGNFNP